MDSSIEAFLTVYLFIVVAPSRYACSLLRQGMKQIVISSETPEVKALEKVEDKSMVAKVNQVSYGIFVFPFVLVVH